MFTLLMYLVRLAMMLVIVLPTLTLSLMMASLLDPAESASIGELAAFWSGMVYIYGGLPAVAVSLVHTAVLRMPHGAGRVVRSEHVASVIVGAVLGAVGGIVSATVTTSAAAAVVLGVGGGVLYGALVGWERFAFFGGIKSQMRS